MGKTLNSVTLHAMVDELQSINKEAALPGFVKAVPKAVTSFMSRGTGKATSGLANMAKHLNPFYSIPAGWKKMTPAMNPNKLESVRKAVGSKPGWFGRHLGEGGAGHLLQPSVGLREAAGSQSSRIKGLAEELSRRGWTGAGAHTKYLPLGTKSWMAGSAVSTIPEVVSAARDKERHPLGEGGPWEKGLGGAAGTASWAMGYPLGMMTGMPLMLGVHALGGRAGRLIDRLRSGVDPVSAVTAPSPEKARKQMENISKYYYG